MRTCLLIGALAASLATACATGARPTDDDDDDTPDAARPDAWALPDSPPRPDARPPLDAPPPADAPVFPDAPPPVDAPPPETVCDDGLDDDGDGPIDCLDSDCDGLAGCEYGSEASCGDGRDNDGDGDADCDDADCGAVPACLIVCPAGSTLSSLSATTPVIIADYETATSTITVPDAGLVTKAIVGMTASHTYVGDLEIQVRSPASTTIDLCLRRGGGGDDFTGTLFADDATVAISAGVAPFTGPYRPEEPLAGLYLEEAAGAWSLLVSDLAGGDPGVLEEFGLHLCICSDCELGARCADTVDNDGDSLADCLDPDCDGTLGCEHGTELSCADGIDNDGDGGADCLDLDCDGVGGCEHGAEATCTDDLDNDGDGVADCHDVDCNGVSGCEVGAEVSCNDGLDNDEDGATDCDDGDCAIGALCGAEADCANGADDDADGLIDCADPGCTPMCITPETPEITCNDGGDNDADGAVDCADSDCSLACAVPACTGTARAYAFVGTGLPAAIYDLDTTTSTIAVVKTGTVVSAAVGFSAVHDWVEDLDVSLIAPSGTTVRLSDDNGGSGWDYTGTIFTDSAATSITSGSAPFTGQYRPEVALSTLAGGTVTGTWTLSAHDDSSFDEGTLTEFRLAVCVEP